MASKEHIVLSVDNKYRPEVDTSSVDPKKLSRKIDLRTIPWLALLYLLNSLDRSSIGNGRIYGLEGDLRITDNQYLWALTCFFFPYAFFEPASNVILKRFRPSIWLSALILTWGIITTCHGVVKNYSGLLAVRFFLGVAESGLYPGAVFYLSSWYTRRELGTKVALFFASGTLAGAFSGLLAAGIQKMDGVGGLEGWRWIFILEGLFTVIIGVLSFYVIQDFPAKAKFLTEEERVYVVRRLQDDMQHSAAGEKLQAKYIWQSLSDVKTWFAMAIYMGFDGPLFSFSLFLPSIIAQLGYNPTEANLLSVPVYAWGCILTVAVGFAGDKIGNRSYINLVLFGIGLVAYVILTASTIPGLSYFAVYLAVAGIYPTIPNSVAWISSNTEGGYKRAVTLGMAIGFGNINGAISANIYRARDKPWYRMGHEITLAYIFLGFVSSVLLRFWLVRENKARDDGLRDEVIKDVQNDNAREVNGTYESVEAAREDKGDYWSGFRYSL